jgi:hypothetical protein
MTTSAERRYLWRVKNLNCVCCGANAPSDAHHIRDGQGMGQKASDYLAVALCKECHQGQNGLHGDRTLMRIYKLSELDLLARTIEQLNKN